MYILQYMQNLFTHLKSKSSKTVCHQNINCKQILALNIERRGNKSKHIVIFNIINYTVPPVFH